MGQRTRQDLWPFLGRCRAGIVGNMTDVPSKRARGRACTLTFLGAAGTVTGSRFLVDTGGSRVLVDCGLFQGERAWRRRNWQPVEVDAASIAMVVLSHAHLDHTGYLPRLVREGFAGTVLCSEATARLTGIILRDAAHLQEEDAAYARRSGYSKHDPPLPLFDTADVEKALALLDPARFDVPQPLPDNGEVRLRRAGHILGSAFVELRVADVRITFSGDLGRNRHPLLRPPERPSPADVVVVESTYGDRQHPRAAVEQLADAVRRTAARGGVILVPAFAVDRTPMLLRVFADLISAGQIPDLPVFVDSPMALSALEVYRDAQRESSVEFRPEVTHRDASVVPSRLRLMATREASASLNDPGRPCIVVSASGMATGGRVLHHLRHQLPVARNTVVLTGYQVAGTRGRALAEGARHVKIHGQYVPVRAEIVALDGFSAHADADELLAWLAQMPPPRTAYVVHGEPAASAELARRLADELDWTVVVPRFEEKVRIG